MRELHWSVLALLASFFWGCVNLADKTILSRYKLTPWDYLALDSLVGLLPLAIILVWSDSVLSVSIEVVMFSILSGIALASFSILYFYALRLSDVIIVVILIQIIPVFSLILGVALLQEHYKNLNYVGMLLILFGAGVASISEKSVKHKVFRNIWATETLLASILMLFGALLMSIGFFVQKLALQEANTISVFFWQRSSLVLISLPILIVRRVQIKQLSTTLIVFSSLVEVINLLGVLSIIMAYSKGPLGIVSFLSSLQPLWILALTWVLNSLNSKLFPVNKNLSRLQLIIACALVVIGLYLIRS